ncbi:MAG: hypothetical protein AAF871_10580 [Pseudomonadota bacterium]
MKDTGFSALRLARTAIRDGHWEGVLTRHVPGDSPPLIDLCYRDLPLAELTLEADAGGHAGGRWRARVAIPVDMLSDGVQTFTLIDRETGLALDSFAVSLGEPLGDDIRAEVDLLRSELDLLKRAFRRHCAES